MTSFLVDPQDNASLNKNSIPNSIYVLLENVFAPGRRLRLSPYIEKLQRRSLAHHQHVNEVDELNNHLREHLKRLAEAWDLHLNKVDNVYQRAYSETDIAVSDCALLYLGSRSVPQIQLVLLETLRQTTFSRNLTVAVCGDSAGIDAVAVADFYIALCDCCNLHGISCPIEHLTITCVSDQLTESEYGRSITQTYLEIADKLAEGIVIHWAQSIAPETTLLLVFSDMESSPRSTEAMMDLAPNATTIVLAPGAAARDLVTWRRSLFERRSDICALGPCGAEFGRSMPAACTQCSPRWLYPLHPTPLYTAMSEAIDQAMGLEAAVYESQLDISFIILGRVSSSAVANSDFAPIDLKAFANGRLCEPVTLRAMGQTPVMQTDTVAVEQAVPTTYMLCPAYSDGDRLTLVASTGKFVPQLRFGTNFEASKVDVRRVGASYELQVTEETEVIPVTLVCSPSFLPQYGDLAQTAVDHCGHRFFGFDHMQPFQHLILEQALTGRDILGIAATGSGKSECFILPALLLPGITVVVSPLKSLMQDQYEQRLRERYGLGDVATIINGDVPFAERQARLRRLEFGEYKLIYFTPEQLERSYVLESLRRANETIGVRYLAMDEAHCVSQWGHDFRSSYLNINRRLRRYGLNPTRIALTATASPKVREDLCEELELKNEPPPDGNVLVISSNRPELNLIVRVTRTLDEKAEAIVEDLKQLLHNNESNTQPGAAIVFMPHAGKPQEPYSNPSARRGKQSARVTGFAEYVERHLQKRVAIYNGKMEDGDEEDGEPERDAVEERRRFGDLTGRTRRGEQNRFIVAKADANLPLFRPQRRARSGRWG